MHTRRMASFLLGAWLLGSVLVSAIAITNAQGVDRLMAAPFPAAAKTIAAAGDAGARQILQYQVYEQNHLVRNYWSMAEIGIGLALTVLLACTSSVSRIIVGVVGAMLLTVLFVHFFVLPELHYLSRASLLAVGPTPHGMRALYAGLESFKLLLGSAVAAYLFVYKGSSRRALRREFDCVDYADHSHVDR
jgi:hypothetical protein